MNMRARRIANRRVSYTMDILRWREKEEPKPARAESARTRERPPTKPTASKESIQRN